MLQIIVVVVDKFICAAFQINFHHLPISCHWSFSITHENIRKSLFFMFSGGIERDQWHEMG